MFGSTGFIQAEGTYDTLIKADALSPSPFKSSTRPEVKESGIASEHKKPLPKAVTGPTASDIHELNR